MLHQHNPELAGEKRKYTVVPPQVARDGTKKTMFSNLVDICRRMHREPTHVIQFLYSELGTTGSVDGSQRLIMKGRYTQKQIETMLKKYIGMFSQAQIEEAALMRGSGVRDLQDLQVGRHHPRARQPAELRYLPGVWLE